MPNHPAPTMSPPVPAVPPVDPRLATVEVYHSEADWLAARRRGIGASEAAAVLGVSRFLSPMDVWSDKLGIAEPRAELERMRWGKRLQGAIALGYAEETGRTLLDPGPWTLVRSVAYPWLHASPDYFLLVAERAALGTLDVKNTSAWARSEWMEEPPLGYQLQVQHQLLVTGCEWGALAALLGGQTLLHVDMPRHVGAVEWLLEDLAAFWRLVETETPPATLDGSARTTAALRHLYPKTTPGAVVPLPPEATEWDLVIREHEERIAASQEVVDTAKNYLRAALKDAERGVLPDGGVWTHKVEHRKGYVKEVPPWEGRVLRRVKGKD